MIDAPQLTRSEARQTAVIHLEIPREEIQQAMGPAIQEVMATLAAQGIQPSGPLFSYHRRMDPKGFDLDVGVPVVKAVRPAGRVVPGRLPACTVARTIYQGGYEGLGAAWGEFGEWVEASGYEAGPDLWECYLAGPETGPDASNWRTELNRPLLGGV